MFVLVTRHISPLARQPFAFVQGWFTSLPRPVHQSAPTDCATAKVGPMILRTAIAEDAIPLDSGELRVSRGTHFILNIRDFHVDEVGMGLEWQLYFVWSVEVHLINEYIEISKCQVACNCFLKGHVMSRFCRSGVFPFSFRCESGPLQGHKSGMAVSLGQLSQHFAPN